MFAGWRSKLPHKQVAVSGFGLEIRCGLSYGETNPFFMQPATAPVDLQSFAEDLTHLAPNPLTYERLCDWVEGID